MCVTLKINTIQLTSMKHLLSAAADGQLLSRLKSPFWNHPSLTAAKVLNYNTHLWIPFSKLLQKVEKNINNKETDGAIIKSPLYSYLFPLLWPIKTASPKAYHVCTPHVSSLPARSLKERTKNLLELMALIWWPDKALTKNQLLGDGDKPWLPSKRTHKSKHLLLALL